METKYLTDGRKVAVLGQLNKNETIVQEIFVKEDGVELPSGENFVVKSLHDEPVISYKNREEKKLDIIIKKLELEIADCSRKHSKTYQELKAIQAVLKSSKKLVEHLPTADISVFTKFLTGTIEYLVIDDYNITPPVPMINQVISWENHYRSAKFDDLKLLGIMGRSDGSLSYSINRYSDGSGGSINVYPFECLEDAVEHIKNRAQEKIKKNILSKSGYSACLDMGIAFDAELLEKYKTHQKGETEKYVTRQAKEISKIQKQIIDAEESLSELG